MQKLPISRTRFGADIVAEFMPPERASKKVIIFLPGAPGYPGGKDAVMEHYARRGYWTIVPRYRGTWESGGTFLEHPLTDDAFIVVDELSVGFRDPWSTTEYRIEEPEVYLIGGSTGGAAALLASRDARVRKVATISGVVDWREQKHTAEPLDLMSSYVPQAFGAAYRSDPSVWHKLADGGFYNPAEEHERIDGKKVLMIHAKDDPIVHIEPSIAFAREAGAQLVVLSSGGHMGTGRAAEAPIARRIERFFKEA